MSCNEWEKVKLGEIAKFSYGKMPKKELLNTGIYPTFSGYKYQYLYPEYNCNRGDLIVVARGVGGTGDVKIVKEKCYLTNLAIKIDLDQEKILNQYLYYKFYLNNLRYLDSGSAQSQITIRDLEKIEISIPPLQEQKAIAKILSDLDEKIEINNRINKVLEEIAQTIFKRWFVDFEFPNENGEPYKSSGGETVESELGLIPKGWEVGKFRDYIETIVGGDWGKETPNGNYIKKVYCTRGADIPEIGVGKKANLPARYILGKNHMNKRLNSNDLVVEISGGSPTQSTGRITYINKEFLKKYDCDVVCTNFCRAITLKNKDTMAYFYFYWKYLYDQNIFFQFENGTTGIKNLDINSFIDNFLIVKPSESILKQYNIFVNVLLTKIQDNGTENSKINQIRDTLLPKLMSGEIRVPIDNVE